jgi:hypothetical protein
VQTPQKESNRPGLPAIAYRTGTWSSFRESMLARLSSSDYPALATLKTRDTDDFSVALLDAASVMLDILTFYQERLANESYLRTATQLFSMTQLGQLLGYQPSPGVSSSTYLAFTLRAAPGLPPSVSTVAVTIPAGSRAQSVPAQGQAPQYFQTSADILAKPDWNAMPVQTGYPWTPRVGERSVYLAGTSTQLNPGDALLVVGDERLGDSGSTQWDLRVVTSVEADTTLQRTLVRWSLGLGGNGGTPAQKNARVYALRQKASLFGYNAINPLMLAPKTLKALQGAGLVDKSSSPEWTFDKASQGPSDLADASVVDLDAAYSKVVSGGWLLTVLPSTSGGSEPDAHLYALSVVASISRSDYGVAAKITRATIDTNTGLYDDYVSARTTTVLAQSELLPLAEQPLDHPLFGTFLDLEEHRPDLGSVVAVAVQGKNQKIVVRLPVSNPPSLAFEPDETGIPAVPLAEGQVYTILQPPAALLQKDGSVAHWRHSTVSLTLAVADAAGRTGTIPGAKMQYFALLPAGKDDPFVQEVALVSQVVPVAAPFPHTRILLKTPLLHCYDRTATSVNANVAVATAGAPVTELLGSGSAATPNQQFTLKQSPLTYIQAPTPTGSQSTLQVRANGARWTGVASLYQEPPTAQVYTTLNMPGGVTLVLGGDGVEGATFPTGQSNLQATYRVGIGATGNVAAGAVATLVDRPAGVSGVTNPMAATGGEDAQSVDDVRRNAPLSVLTLGRAVSITDYQNFSSSFAGIARATAIWIPSGPFRGVFVTVAGAGGAALPPGNLTLGNLVTALKSFGNPRVAVYAASYLETTFGVSADLTYDPAYEVPAVQAAALALLQDTYCFANRTFGLGVSADEIAALLQGVPGVVAVNVTNVGVVATSPAGDIGVAGYSVAAYNAWRAQALTTPLPRRDAGSPSRICPYAPIPSLTALPLAAEILVLDPNPASVALGVMS